MRGWDFDPKFRDYDLVGKHCAAYAKNFWNRYVGYSSNNNQILSNLSDEVTTPALISNSIWVMHTTNNTGY